MWPLLLQSLLATTALRTPLREAGISYLKHPHKRLDPYVVPVLKAWYKADKTIMKPVDWAAAYADSLRNRIGPP
jgi:hypothetical protein